MFILSAIFSLTLQQNVDTLTLEAALARAEVNSPRARLAHSVVAQAEGALATLGIVPNPLLSLEHDDLAPTNKLLVSQKFDWLLKRSADRKRGSAGIESARADSTQMMAELARDVRLAFYRSLAALEEFNLAQRQLAAMDTLAIFAERRLTAGDISALERDQVLLEVFRWRQTVSRSRETVRSAEIQLSAAIAVADATPVGARGALDTDLSAGAAILDAASMGNIDALPTVRVALANVNGAEANITSANLARIPMPGLVAGREWGDLDPGTRSIVLGFSISIPLWNQGGAPVRDARATRERAAALAEAARIDASARINTARVVLTEATTRARAARDSILPMSTRLRQSAVRLFDAGRTSVLAVFDAFRQERDAATAAYDDLRAFQEARANALALLGRAR